MKYDDAPAVFPVVFAVRKAFLSEPKPECDMSGGGVVAPYKESECDGGSGGDGPEGGAAAKLS